MEIMEMKRELSRLPHSNMYSTYMTITVPALTAAPSVTMSTKAMIRKLRRSSLVPGAVGKRISSGASGFAFRIECSSPQTCLPSGMRDATGPAHRVAEPSASSSRACFCRARSCCSLDSDSGVTSPTKRTKKMWQPNRT